MAKNTGARPVPPEVKPAPQGAKKSGETVTVACKLPNGLIIRGFRKVEATEPVLGGGLRTVQKFEEDGRRVHIFGNARPKGGSAKTRIVAGYALTTGVDKELMDEWLEANADTPMVKNKIIMVLPSIDQAVDAAREHQKVRSGLEPLNPVIEKDPRVPRPVDPQLGEIKMDDQKMSADQFEDVEGEAA